VLAQPNGLAPARLGLALPRRRFQSAVERNRIKRIVRETFREHLDDLKGLDVVVMLKRSLPTGSLDAPHGALSRLWARVSQCATS